jgi:hypothetical protein
MSPAAMPDVYGQTRESTRAYAGATGLATAHATPHQYLETKATNER